MRRLLHHPPRDRRRMPDVFQSSNAAAIQCRPFHDAGIQLHDPERIRQSAIADRSDTRIIFHGLHSRDSRVQRRSRGVPILAQRRGLRFVRIAKWPRRLNSTSPGIFNQPEGFAILGSR